MSKIAAISEFNVVCSFSQKHHCNKSGQKEKEQTTLNQPIVYTNTSHKTKENWLERNAVLLWQLICNGVILK